MQLVVLVYQFNYESSGTLVDAGFYFTYGCLVPIVVMPASMYGRVLVLTSTSQAIYPTVIIVLTAVNCSPLDWGLSPLGELVEAPSGHRRAHLTLSIIRFRPPTLCNSTFVQDEQDTVTPRWMTRYSGVFQSPQTPSPHREACMFEPEMLTRDESPSPGAQAPVRRDRNSIAVAV